MRISLRRGGAFRRGHAPTQLELDGFGVRDGDVTLQVLDGFFGRDVALAVGLVDVDLWVVNLVRDQQADAAVRHLAEQVEDGELDRRHGHEDGEAGGLVVVLVDRDFFQQRLQVAGVLADEERRDAFREDRIQHLHLLRVGDGDAFGAVLGTHAAQEAFAVLVVVAKQLDGGDDDGVVEEPALEDRQSRGGVALGVIGLQFRGSNGMMRRPGWLGSGGGGCGEDGGGRGGQGRLQQFATSGGHTFLS